MPRDYGKNTRRYEEGGIVPYPQAGRDIEPNTAPKDRGVWDKEKSEKVFKYNNTDRNRYDPDDPNDPADDIANRKERI